MAVKTFTQGEKLTTADTNTYLANSGLVYVKHVAITNAAEVQVNNCFNGDFTSYQIVLSQASHATTATNIQFRMRVNATGNETGSVYYDARWQYTYASATFGAGNTNGGNISTTAATITNGNTLGTIIFIDNPYGTDSTSWWNQGADSRTVGGFKAAGGYVDTNTSYDSIAFFPATGSFAATGTITVYGYRKG